MKCLRMRRRNWQRLNHSIPRTYIRMGDYNNQTGPILLSSYISSYPYLCTCQIRKQSDKEFLSLNPKYEFLYFFVIFGGSWGDLTSNPGERIFQGSKTSAQSRHMFNKEKHNHLFFTYMGHNIKQNCILGYSGGGGAKWPINNRTGPILLPSYPLTYINLHIKYGSNPIRIFLSYRVNDVKSAADAA